MIAQQQQHKRRIKWNSQQNKKKALKIKKNGENCLYISIITNSKKNGAK